MWRWYSELSGVVQALVAGVSVVVVGLLVRVVGRSVRPRRSTVYVVPESADQRGHNDNDASAGRSSPDRFGPTPDVPPPDVHELRFEDGRSDDEFEELNRELVEGGLDPEPARPQLSTAEWARGRSLCPCCGYPGGYEPWTATKCRLCDWDDPSAATSEWGVPRSEWRKAVASARSNYAAYGSALTPEDRAEWAGELTAGQVELRREARRLFDYLRSGERPDTSEVLEQADAILAQLRESEDRPRWVDEA